MVSATEVVDREPHTTTTEERTKEKRGRRELPRRDKQQAQLKRRGAIERKQPQVKQDITAARRIMTQRSKKADGKTSNEVKTEQYMPA